VLRQSAILELVLEVVVIDVVLVLSAHEDHEVVVPVCGRSVCATAGHTHTLTDR
jgi:hypothetical protein